MRGTDHAKAMGVVIEEVQIKEGSALDKYEDINLEEQKMGKCPCFFTNFYLYYSSPQRNKGETSCRST